MEKLSLTWVKNTKHVLLCFLVLVFRAAVLSLPRAAHTHTFIYSTSTNI